MDSADFIEKIEKIKMIYRILIFLGTVILLCVLFIFLVYFPKTDEIAKITKKNKQISQKIAEAVQKTKNLEEFREDVAQVDAQYQEALTLLPKKEEIPSLLRNISELGTTSDLTVNSFSPKKGAVEHMYTEIIASIKVMGKYHDVLLFFDKVGKMKRIVNIRNVSMNPAKSSKEGSEESITKLNVTCSAFTYKFNE